MGLNQVNQRRMADLAEKLQQATLRESELSAQVGNAEGQNQQLQQELNFYKARVAASQAWGPSIDS